MTHPPQTPSPGTAAADAVATLPEGTAATTDTTGYTPWTQADCVAFDQALMHESLENGPLSEMVEGFITGTVISPFNGLAEELLAPLLSLFELDLDTFPADAREPLIAIVQKRMDAILDGMDQTRTAAIEGTQAVGLEPLLTDWETARSTSGEQGEPGAPAPHDLPRMAELWARGMQLAHLVWREDHWNRIDKHTRKDIDRQYRPINALSASDKTAVTDARQRDKLLEDSLDSVHGLYGMTQNYHDRLAVTPAPITKAVVPGRNDPCHCGSGKKYKKCCGA